MKTLASEISQAEPGTMLVDVGTNGEIMYLGKDGLSATSCATGPAFEGASISHGMHAVSGAIDAVNIDKNSGKTVCSNRPKCDPIFYTSDSPAPGLPRMRPGKRWIAQTLYRMNLACCLLHIRNLKVLMGIHLK